MFDEQPDGDPHGECAAEIHRLGSRLKAIFSHWNEFGSEHGFGELMDLMQTDAYAEGRADELADCKELIAWAYGKLHHINFTRLEDALMLDRIKLLLEHGVHT